MLTPQQNLVPPGGNDPPTLALSRRCSTTELRGHINNCMITTDEAVQTLLDIAQGEYVQRLSYTCVKEFTLSFPKKDQLAFVPDSLPIQIGAS